MARYSDEFRANAVIMLEVAGYPKRKGALTQVARELNVSHSLIRRWFLKSQNPPPSNLVQEKRFDLVQAIRDELAGLFPEMVDARQDASYRDLATAAGILIDKLQLLQNKPTAIVKLQRAIEQGLITPEQARERWPSLAEKLFAEAQFYADSGT